MKMQRYFVAVVFFGGCFTSMLGLPRAAWQEPTHPIAAAPLVAKQPSIFRDQSYFGIIRVKSAPEKMDGATSYKNLLHGITDHGMNFQKPDVKVPPTVYYDRQGPAGAIMEKFNWFSHDKNAPECTQKLRAAVESRRDGSG